MIRRRPRGGRRRTTTHSYARVPLAQPPRRLTARAGVARIMRRRATSTSAGRCQTVKVPFRLRTYDCDRRCAMDRVSMRGTALLGASVFLLLSLQAEAATADERTARAVTLEEAVASADRA